MHTVTHTSIHTNRQSTRHTTSKGFTLSELLAIISIMGIMGAFALPSFQSLSTGLKADLAADRLYHHLNMARTEAIMKNTVTTVCASHDGLSCHTHRDWSDSYILSFHDMNQNGQIDTNDTVISSLSLELEKNSLTWKSFGNKAYLQWQPSGMTHYQNGNFTYCPGNRDEHHAKKLILNAAGRVYFGHDRNGDGIQEGSDGKNLRC